MVWLISIVLMGIVQGLTEFLPVSSSGHLTMLQYFSATFEEDLALNVAVHIGTLGTVLVYYRKDLASLLSGLLRRDQQSLRMVMLIIIATIPTGVIGIGFKKIAPGVLTSPIVAGFCLLVTAIILFVSDKMLRSRLVSRKPRLSDGLILGVVQGCAVLPGISRSGSTIVTGLALGMKAEDAARFSFLASIPAIAGAGLLEFLDARDSLDWTTMGVGAFVSFLVGLFAISWTVRFVVSQKLRIFSYYLFPAGLTFLVLYYLQLGQGVI